MTGKGPTVTDAMVEAGRVELHSNWIDEIRLQRIYTAMETATNRASEGSADD